jgi:hypothetical protein
MNRKPFQPAPTFHPELVQTNTREFNEMLMHEALARARMREAEQAAQRDRLARRVAAARSWQRLAAWTARRAAKANSAL